LSPLIIPYPEIDPVLFAIGPIAIRWYALAYIAGLVLGWRYMRWLSGREPVFTTKQAIDDFLLWATIGVVIGGRLGYVLFYNPGYYLSHPVEILYVWTGGMSFHGGFLGVVVAVVLFSRSLGVHPLRFGDLCALAAPIGLFFGRVANFINGELFGRPTDVPWAMVFPAGGPLPRHPSQLYEAALEGLLLFFILLAVELGTDWRSRPGLMTGVFVAGYGVSRFIVEFAREPDEHLTDLALGMSMGQWLSLPMILIGLGLIAWRRQRT